MPDTPVVDQGPSPSAGEGPPAALMAAAEAIDVHCQAIIDGLNDTHELEITLVMRSPDGSEETARKRFHKRAQGAPHVN